MARCIAKTKSGRQCKNTALPGKRYCSVHNNNTDYSEGGAITLGALAANAVFPGIGGLFGGGVLGKIAHSMHVNRKTKVFISFDFENDRKLKHYLIGQSKLTDSPFVVIDHSLREASPEPTWEEVAYRAIKKSDIMIVILGQHTYRAQGVLKEIRCAKKLHKQIIQLVGYRDQSCPRIKGAGRVYRWKWDTLKRVLMH